MDVSRLARALPRSAFVGATLALMLVTTGCVPSGDANAQLASPLLERFNSEQNEDDRLPLGAPARLMTVPDSARFLGSEGTHHFYAARGLVAPYCLVVMNLYAQQVFQHCGGDNFGGVLWDGRRFEFGVVWARAIPRVDRYSGYGEHLVVEAREEPWGSFPLVRELVDRPQSPSDFPPLYSDHELYDLGSMRFLASDGDRNFYLARSTLAWRPFCVFEHERDSMSGTCGPGDVVIPGVASIVHFSPAGFDDAVPVGWRQLSELLRVSDTGVSGGGPIYASPRD